MFEKLNEQDKTNIYNYIKTYSGEVNASESSRAGLGYLLRYWDSNKKRLCDLLGNNLIIEKEITIGESVCAIEDRLYEAVHSRSSSIGKFYRHFMDSIVKKADIHSYTCIERMFRSDYLASNKYDGDTFTVQYNNKKVTIQNGCKPVKMLGKLVRLFGIDEKDYEAFRLAQSLETNQKKLKGTLCLSIHPLDYMTMSDNESGWESCMSWMNQGCYCRGTVEMMNSPYVIVAYLKADDDMRVNTVEDSFYWNNKKWRQLFICDENFMTSIKAYPYRNDDLSFMVLDWLRELAATNWHIEYNENSIYKYRRTSEAFRDKIAKFNFLTNTMYNDFGTIEHHIMVNKEYYDSTDELSFTCNYSGEEICMFCGSDCSYFLSEGKLVCEDCDGDTYCDDCGESANYNDMYEVDGEMLCPYCYEAHTAVDPITGDIHHENNMMEVWFLPEEALNNEKNIDLFSYPSIYIYRGHDSDTLAQYFNLKDGDFSYMSRNSWGMHYRYVTISMLKNSAYELFNGNYNSNEDLIQEIIKK